MDMLLVFSPEFLAFNAVLLHIWILLYLFF